MDTYELKYYDLKRQGRVLSLEKGVEFQGGWTKGTIRGRPKKMWNNQVKEEVRKVGLR